MIDIHSWQSQDIWKYGLEWLKTDKNFFFEKCFRTPHSITWRYVIPFLRVGQLCYYSDIYIIYIPTTKEPSYYSPHTVRQEAILKFTAKTQILYNCIIKILINKPCLPLWERANVKSQINSKVKMERIYL